MPADLIIHELHVGTFSPEGTFDGVTRRLPAACRAGRDGHRAPARGRLPGSPGLGVRRGGPVRAGAMLRPARRPSPSSSTRRIAWDWPSCSTSSTTTSAPTATTWPSSPATTSRTSTRPPGARPSTSTASTAPCVRSVPDRERPSLAARVSPGRPAAGRDALPLRRRPAALPRRACRDTFAHRSRIGPSS